MSMSSEPGSETPHSRVVKVSGMYQDYFLDYASYVILERAVPLLDDGLKPVQRRLLHALDELHDGRYHKVANVIGHTMKYHPHGDASIGDALVQLGQKDLLIDCQGNWGNVLTGDSAAAPRYIEARLTPFALEVVYNPRVTQWQASYDGRGKEPLSLPVRFPLLLAQGVEGIAVGLSTRILPHNFNELCDAAVAVLEERPFVLCPDFATGGWVDVEQYQDGLRGGRIRVRARISDLGNRTLQISEIPFGTNTGSLIESILKANDKGKIKIRKIEDNTAENAEILIHLPPGVSPDKTIDALYAFTDCEVSISPLCCVIHEDRPEFIGVSEVLKRSVEHTRELLRRDLELRLEELGEQWHFASLERIFIEHKVYREIEEAETWEAVLSRIRIGLEPHIDGLLRAVTEDDIVKLTEIRIKRISKFDSTKADEHLLKLEGDMEALRRDLSELTRYTIDWFRALQRKYGPLHPRKTEIRRFDGIKATEVAMANAKLYVNRAEGFVGMGLKKDEYVGECSDLDDIIVICADGKMKIFKVDQKTFAGNDILHVGVYRKGDERTVYNLIYYDGLSQRSFVKRFAVTGVTRDKEYDLTQGHPKSKILYLTVNPNGEAEQVLIHLKAAKNLRKPKIEFDFAEMAVRSRNSKGNLVTRYPVRKIELRQQGISTLGARKIWFDESVLRLNMDGRGRLLGSFGPEDLLMELCKDGRYRCFVPDLSVHLDPDGVLLERVLPEQPCALVYFDGIKQRYFAKRFLPETTAKPERIVSEHPDTRILYALYTNGAELVLHFEQAPGKPPKEPLQIPLDDFVGVKGLKALGNQLSAVLPASIELCLPEPEPELEPEPETLSEPEAKAAGAVDLSLQDSVSLEDDGQIVLDF
ncbi:DNA gyrase/topoisomerase IV subunit A [bacterium]|nr:DNA gyrase/topoisomerase IV subunit A [bacterium]